MKSQVIYKGQHYTACAMRDGSLIVTRNSAKAGGVRLVGAQAPIWIDSIRTAIDGDEAHALCRAVITSAY
jgi:hypothetical protein